MAAREFKIHGIVPIVPTPFDGEEQIAWDELRGLIDFACAAGACAVCLPAYASEFYKLSEEERFEIVAAAIRHSAGRVPVIAQVNYASASRAAEVAVAAAKHGAAAVNVAVPRLFPLSERDLGRYFERILKAIEIPLIIQDFNPGGPSLTPQFIAALHGAWPQFRYVKLEEPMLAAKVRAILDATGGEVGVIEGWGGMYTLELVAAGICGVMPGLALTDLLAQVFRLASEGKREEAYEIFQEILPQIVFSLQNLELFHHAEKLLLQARGVLREAHVRQAGMELLPHDEEHIRFLNSRVLAALEQRGLGYR